MSTESTTWFPLFEFQDWIYQSFLLLPTPQELDAAPGTPATARKWARGELLCGQAFTTPAPGGYVLSGVLSFRPGVTLTVSAQGTLGVGNAPATFEATGVGTEGATLGAIYRLVGWVFPELPILNGGGRVDSVRGAIWAVRGTDARPDIDLSGMPLGTVGSFVIAKS
jgi:hypothetical protein